MLTPQQGYAAVHFICHTSVCNKLGNTHIDFGVGSLVDEVCMCQQDRVECCVEVLLLGVLANCPSVFEHAWLLRSMLWDFNAIHLGLLAQNGTVTIGEWYLQQNACMFQSSSFVYTEDECCGVVWYYFCTLP
jgi:uncharacterized protein YcgI (DUF1989 family)